MQETGRRSLMPSTYYFELLRAYYDNDYDYIARTCQSAGYTRLSDRRFSNYETDTGSLILAKTKKKIDLIMLLSEEENLNEEGNERSYLIHTSTNNLASLDTQKLDTLRRQAARLETLNENKNRNLQIIADNVFCLGMAQIIYGTTGNFALSLFVPAVLTLEEWPTKAVSAGIWGYANTHRAILGFSDYKTAIAKISRDAANANLMRQQR